MLEFIFMTHAMKGALRETYEGIELVAGGTSRLMSEWELQTLKAWLEGKRFWEN